MNRVKSSLEPFHRCWWAGLAALLLVVLLLVSGCAIFGGGESTRVWFHEQVDAMLPEKHRREVTVPVSNLRLFVNPHPTLTEQDLVSAEVVETNGGPAILLRFDRHGLHTLDQMTTRNRGRYIVVFLDGAPLAAWLVDRRLSLGQFLLEAKLSSYQAREIVKDLNRQAKKK